MEHHNEHITRDFPNIFVAAAGLSRNNFVIYFRFTVGSFRKYKKAIEKVLNVEIKQLLTVNFVRESENICFRFILLCENPHICQIVEQTVAQDQFCCLLTFLCLGSLTLTREHKVRKVEIILNVNNLSRTSSVVFSICILRR